MNQQSVDLDVLRSVAVSLVVFTHLSFMFGYGNRFHGLGHIGYFGVFLFFIHTSLVLMMSLERLRATGGAVTGRFYIRRAFRIYPLSILTVLVVLLLKIPAYLEPTYKPLSTAAIWANLLLVQNVPHLPDAIGPFWSLPYEVQMYLVLPFLYVAARRIQTYRGALVLIAVGFAARYVEGLVAQAVGYHALLSYAPWFCMGVAAYGLSKHVVPRWNPRWFAVGLAVFVGAPWLSSEAVRGWAMWVVGVPFALLLPYFCDFTGPVVHRLSHWIAKYSYGLYVAHIPIMWFAYQKLALPRAVQTLVFFALVIAIPALLYHAVEEPMIRAGARIAQKLVRERGAVAATAARA
jgi:peptidoglycan/LPS O-acetylase OafA/YrhL